MCSVVLKNNLRTTKQTAALDSTRMQNTPRIIVEDTDGLRLSGSEGCGFSSHHVTTSKLHLMDCRKIVNKEKGTMINLGSANVIKKRYHYRLRIEIGQLFVN